MVRDIQVRADPQTQREKLTFRIERYTASGNRLPPVPVEVRRYRGGSLTDGDEVEVGGRWSRGTLRARRIRNLTTLSEVRGRNLGWAKWIAALLVLPALGAGGFETYAFVRNQTSDAVLKIPIVNQSPLPDSAGSANQQPVDQQPVDQQPAKQQPPKQQPPKQQPPKQQPPKQQPAMVTDVVGLPLSAAINRLKSMGLDFTIIREPSESVPADSVIGTDPALGVPLPDGTVVKISVSSGSASPASDPAVPASDPTISAT